MSSSKRRDKTLFAACFSILFLSFHLFQIFILLHLQSSTVIQFFFQFRSDSQLEVLWLSNRNTLLSRRYRSLISSPPLFQSNQRIDVKMASDKNTRTRKSGNSKTPIEGQLPSDNIGAEGHDGSQVISLLTGGSKEAGSTTLIDTNTGTQSHSEYHNSRCVVEPDHNDLAS